MPNIFIRNITSPYGLAVISSVVFSLAWVFPPSLYTYYIGEQDLMFLDVTALVFYTLCVTGFCLGVRAAAYISPHYQGSAIRRMTSGSPLAFLLIPVGISTALCMVSGLIIGSNVSNLLSLLLAQQGALIKLAGNAGQLTEGKWSYAIFMHMGVIWWSYWRSRQLSLTVTSARLYNIALGVALAVGVVTSIMRVDRTSLMPMIAGLLILYLYRQVIGVGAGASRIVMYGAGGACVTLLVFLFLSFLRGATVGQRLATDLIGYSLTSYNRLSALLHGLLKYPYSGNGLYLSSFLAYNNTLNAYFPANKLLGAPPYDQVFLSEFPAITAAGLHSAFNWPGVFGYIYADLGWWTPAYLLPIGMFAGALWSMFQRGRIAGVILYPWVAFWILFWFGANVLFDTRMVVLALLAVLLWPYEHLLIRRESLIDSPRIPSVFNVVR